jgi:hypothetical protein
MTACLLLTASMAHADTLETDVFSLDIPPGFTRVDNAKLEAHYHYLVEQLESVESDILISMRRSSSQFDYAYSPPGVVRFDSPHMIVDIVMNMDVMDTEGEVLGNMIKADLARMCKEATGELPEFLYENYDPTRDVYTVEYKTEGGELLEKGVHNVTAAFTNQGYVAVYWYTSLDDYGSYVTTLRKVSRSLTVKPAYCRKETCQ